MNIQSHTEFPPLNYNTHLSYDSFLQEQFVLFQFNLTRKSSCEHVQILYNDLIIILKFIKKYIHHYNNDTTHKSALLLHLNFFLNSFRILEIFLMEKENAFYHICLF